MSWIFYGLCFLIQQGSILQISAEGPIYNIITQIFIFLCASFIYIQMDFYFIGQTYIIVYVGAIAILFLFVIMMIDLQPIKNDPLKQGLIIGIQCFIGLIFNNSNTEFIYTYYNSDWYIIWDHIFDIKAIGRIQYIGYPLALIQQGIALWGVMIGIISITNGGLICDVLNNLSFENEWFWYIYWSNCIYYSYLWIYFYSIIF